MSENLLPVTPTALPAATPPTATAASLSSTEAQTASAEGFMQALTQSLPATADGVQSAETAAGFAELATLTGTLPAATAGTDLPVDGNGLPAELTAEALDPQLLNLVLAQHAPAPSEAPAEASDTDSELPDGGLARAIADAVGLDKPRPRAALMAVLHAAGNSAVATAALTPESAAPGADPLGQLVSQAVQQVKAAVNAQAEGGASNMPGMPATAATTSGLNAPATLTQNATTTPLTQSLDLPVRHEAWGEALGQRVQWMVGQKLQSAQLTLNPQHLGTLEVRINIQHDQAVINFHSPHAVVREALEAALPRLREMFGEQGLSLAQANVSQQSFAEQQRWGGGQETEAASRRDAAFAPGDEGNASPTVKVRGGQGLLDTFA